MLRQNVQIEILSLKSACENNRLLLFITISQAALPAHNQSTKKRVTSIHHEDGNSNVCRNLG
jgi:hypothetical protein